MLDSPSGAPTRGAREETQREQPKPAQRLTPVRQSDPTDDDRRLITRLLERESAAWTEFLRRFERLIASRVIATCREVGVEPRADLVDDCGAELMATLFHNDLAGLRRFEGRSKLSTWLAVIARRTALGILRRRLRDAEEIAQPDSRFDLATIADTKPTQTALNEQQNNERLQAAIQQLSASDRQILQLQFEQQLSYAAIGRMLGISENAVGPKLHRAQTRLKKLMRRPENE